MVRYCILLFLISSAATAQPQRRWKFQTQDKIYSSPFFSNNTLYIGSGDGHVYALDATTGTLRWKFKTGGAVHSSPVVDSLAVYFLSHDGNAYAVSINDGSLRWKFATKGERVYDMWDYFQSSPVIAGDKIIFGSGD